MCIATSIPVIFYLNSCLRENEKIKIPDFNPYQHFPKN